MSFNVSYTSLPTFQTNSIGYSENKSGTITLPANPYLYYNFTNFNLGIGVYIITINIWNLLQPASGSGYSNFYYSFGISNSSSTITTYLSNTYGISFGGSTVIQNTTASTIYVNIYSGGGSGVPSNFSSYNVSIVRIA